MYAKLYNQTLHWLQAPLKTANGDVFTNEDAILREHGYKPVILSEIPSQQEGYYMRQNWVETENAIVQTWEPILLEEDELTDALNALQVLGVSVDGQTD